MIKLKDGGGGQLQAYDDENGEYVKVSVKIGGKEFSNYDEFRNYLNQSPNFMERLKKDPEGTEQKALDTYRELFQNKINSMNDTKVSRFKDVYDLIDNTEKLFTPERVKKIKNICPPDKIEQEMHVSPIRGDTIPNITVAMFNAVYGTPYMKSISEDDFQKEYYSDNVAKEMTMKEFAQEGYDNGMNTIRMLESIPQGKSIPFFRGLYALTGERAKTAVRGFFSGKEGVTSSITYISGGGSGIYTAPTANVAKTGVDGGYANGGIVVHGIIDNASDLKVADSRVNRKGHANTEALHRMQSLLRYDYDVQNKFLENVSNTLFKNGYGTMQECLNFSEKLNNEVNKDSGMAGALLGLDALVGWGMEIVILNPNVCRISRSWNEVQKRR